MSIIVKHLRNDLFFSIEVNEFSELKACKQNPYINHNRSNKKIFLIDSNSKANRETSFLVIIKELRKNSK